MYICNNCGNEYSRWAGKCDACGEWNSLKEVSKKDVEILKDVEGDLLVGKSDVVKLSAGEASGKRIKTGLEEWDRLLGGGIVVGSIGLFGGEPGIGKSTLMIQVCDALAVGGKKVLYVSGEESLAQVGGRAKRLGLASEKIDFLGGVLLEQIEAIVDREKYDLVVIDSIQTLVSRKISSGMGSVTQTRYCASRLMQLSKLNNVAIFLIGHVTKEGEVAGPKVLEHLVDIVVYFEGERTNDLRVVRALKNRYGSTDETGVFVMTERGLESVVNISKMFLAERKKGLSGSAISVSLEGTRPFLVEIQAIADRSGLANPRRTSTGVTSSRLSMLLAVLGKRGGVDVYDKDIYLNVVGGFKLNDRSTDLGVLAAMASAVLDRQIGDNAVFVGEVGLLGEIRGVKSLEKRIKEAFNMGFNKIYTPKISGMSDERLVVVEDIRDLFGRVFI